MEGTKPVHFMVTALSAVLLLGTVTTAAWAIDNEACMDCHGDQSLSRSQSNGMKASLYVDFDKFKYSVHNVNGIACVDCHADITKLDMDQEVPHSVNLAPVACDTCHPEVAEAYANSVHKKASNKGVSIPCYACHAYHDTTRLDMATVSERQNSFCLKCHNPNKFHEWLPAKENHFALVDCTVCHAPAVPRHLNLRFFDLVEQSFLKGDVILRHLNTTKDEFSALVDRNGDGIIDVQEFEDMVLMLRQRDIRGVFHGELVVDMEPVVHQVNRGEANRDCSQCHSATSAFFQDVRLTFDMDDGSVASFNVDRQALQTYFVEFNALGTTRVRLLDKIGIALIGGGVAVVIIHLSARLLTIP
ncbi:MAG: ammonia-forming cytochrome c nitrite reductase subunit c552, partial [Desulfobulbaceae bacterium]|nr:ammonia-forming cytochrome c nitrite reductase subunit c552 [Desulfobulbaceae bacterium]